MIDNILSEVKGREIAYLVKRNFAAKLPDDFYILLKVTKPDDYDLINDSYMDFAKINCRSKFITENFYIDGNRNRIVFSGNYNKWCVVRIFQKLIEKIFPKVYKIEYIKLEK